MSGLVIKNGLVFDPINGIDGEKKDIYIEDGKIVGSPVKNAKEIDASNLIVMPGGVDIHSHIAGTKVNAGRLLRPEDHVKDVVAKTNVRRAGAGHSVPTTYVTGYRYAEMGYTTVFEPATPPFKTRHTHEEMDETPIIDKGCFPLLGNNWFVMDYIKENKYEECKDFVAWLLEAVKGYAVKIVNPGGVEAWGWGKYVTHLDDPVPEFEVTPREIIRWLCKINLSLKNPHPIHLHTNNLAKPGNYKTTIETMDCIKDLAPDSEPIIHVTHVQFTGRSGTSWANIGSGAPEIAEYVNGNKHVEIDVGQIVFGDTTTMTADGSFQFLLHLLSGNKWVNSDVEAETGAGVVPIKYRKGNYVNAVQWGIGLELSLLIKDPWRVHLTTDHPNGGPFTEYPKVFAWLMSRKARERLIKKINSTAKRRLSLEDIDREYSLYEIAITTRAAQAKSLGLADKGHLGEGADADVAVYNLDVKNVDPAKDYVKVRKAFRRAAYTVKDGEVVSKDGEIIKAELGRTFWVKPPLSTDRHDTLLSNISERFKEFYTIEMDNYMIEESYLARPQVIQSGGQAR